ncbi:hypothetical protein DPX16_16432 [Anabarilius grahami]|uniref:Uncharacterized protein n=1 Tax=Anabarilius grahami TaxID=495550 RepID=A0A3N0XZF8_ANAGA|nr:hypothetical protein DPX16_16432 [Anabarilius grahami]
MRPAALNHSNQELLESVCCCQHQLHCSSPHSPLSRACIVQYNSKQMVYRLETISAKPKTPAAESEEEKPADLEAYWMWRCQLRSASAITKSGMTDK